MPLPPLPDEQWTDRTRSALAVLLPEHRRNVRGAGSALATLARHPDLAEAFLTFSKHLMLNSTLPAGLREIAILRVARRRACVYEWNHHVRIAAKAGLSAAEIEAAGRGQAEDALKRAVLKAVDELEEHSTLSSGTWATLGEHLDERQLMDLIFTVGGYCLMAMAFNAFGVEFEHAPQPATKGGNSHVDRVH